MLEHKVPLEDHWHLLLDFEQSLSTLEEAVSASGWVEAPVPGCWEQVSIDKKSDGAVWYRHLFNPPVEWQGKATQIDFEGVNYYCQVWLNRSFLGEHEGGWAGFSMSTGEALRFNEPNEMIVKVWKQGNRYPLRECLAGFLPDVSVIFGGIWKPVWLRVIPSAELCDVFVKPRIQQGGVEVEWSLRQPNTPLYEKLGVHFEISDSEGAIIAAGKTNAADESAFIPMEGELKLWSPEHPNLYEITATLVKEDAPDKEEALHVFNCRFGMKSWETAGDRLLLNGRPVYLRGVLHWGWYGNTIAPIPTRDEIRAELLKIKESGFNLVKHCLYVPVRDYFELADEIGIILWQELPMWLPQVTEAFKQRVFQQYEAILKEIRGYASVAIWTLGCELDQAADSTFLEELYHRTKLLTDHAMIRDNSGSGECYGGLLKEYADFYDYHFYTEPHFFADLLREFAGSWRPKKPWLFGEFCDYDEYRDWDKVMEGYGGIKPWWLQSDPVINPGAADVRWQYHRQREKVDALQLPFSDKELHANAGKSGYIYRKSVLEQVRTYPGITGYVLTSLKDTPIATSAIFDDFGESKVPAELLRRINNDTVISLTWDHRRDWVHNGDRLVRWDPYNYESGAAFRPHVFVSHYGPEEITDAKISWQLTDTGALLAAGSINGFTLDTGTAKEAGVIEARLPHVSVPTKLKLDIALGLGDRRIDNEWEFWLFPKVSLSLEAQCAITLDDPLHLFHGIRDFYTNLDHELRPDSKIIITSQLRDEHYAFAHAGGSVFYVQRGKGRFTIKETSFWRESIQLFYPHPVMDAFPHEQHTGMPFFGLASDTVFAEGDPQRRPILDRLDARKFELDRYLFEQRLSQGKLMATTLRFEGGLGSQPSGLRQHPAARYWLDAILRYLSV